MLNYIVDKEHDQQSSPFRNKVNFEKHYELVKHLGDGKFGKVYHVKDRKNNKEYAAKFIKIKRESDRADVEREVSILKNLEHLKIVELHDAFSTLSNNVVLIMEIVKGGELFDRIADENYIVSEPDAQRIIKQLCEALHYIHHKNIIHLDIKPENIMLLSQNKNEIKLIDFGLARFYDGKEDIKFMAGTPEFAAPEVIKFENLDFHTDMWSVGIITYILLSGYSPFLGDNVAETYCNVEKGEWVFTEEFESISKAAKDFISKLLVYDKQSRMLPAECLKHPWLTEQTTQKNKKGENQIHSAIPVENDTKFNKDSEINYMLKFSKQKPEEESRTQKPTTELTVSLQFARKNIKRGIIRRIKCESFCVVSMTLRRRPVGVSRPIATQCISEAYSYTKRKLMAPKRATKRSDDNVLTAQEMKASIASRKTPMLATARYGSIVLTETSNIAETITGTVAGKQLTPNGVKNDSEQQRKKKILKKNQNTLHGRKKEESCSGENILGRVEGEQKTGFKKKISAQISFNRMKNAETHHSLSISDEAKTTLATKLSVSENDRSKKKHLTRGSVSKIDVTVKTTTDEFSYVRLKEKLECRVQDGLDYQKHGGNEEQKCINLPSALSVRDRTLKFEKLKKS